MTTCTHYVHKSLCTTINLYTIGSQYAWKNEVCANAAAYTAKAYLISPTNSLTFPKTEECSAVIQNFKSDMG